MITDNYKYVHNLGIINKILNSANNIGFSMICTTNDITKLPSQCKMFIQLNKDNIVLFESDS